MPLLQAVGGRPTLMQRFPNGVKGNSFFQKRVPENIPDWLQTTTVATPNGTTSRALVLADLAHVLWAVNLGCLGFHTWPCLAADPAHTDELRIDLDPVSGIGFDAIREAALEVRALLDEVGVASFPKTTGSKGIHVYARLEPRWDSYDVRAAAVALARELERRRPDLLTAAWWKEERGKRVFIDFNQNAPHKTVFAPWSVRSRVGAQVSTPMSWDEVATVRPDELTLDDRARPRRRRGQPVGRHERRSAVDRRPARVVRARSGRRLDGCTLAAGVPEAAERATESCAEPRQEDLIRPSYRSASSSAQTTLPAPTRLDPHSLASPSMINSPRPDAVVARGERN